MSIAVPKSDQIMAAYLNQQAPSRSPQFWEAWMLNEDPQVIGNNPLNIMTGASSLPPSIQSTITGQQPNTGAYNFDTPQDGAIATVYWLQHEGYNDIVTAPADGQAITDLAKKHGVGYFNGGGLRGAQSYSQHIAQTYIGIDPKAQNFLGGVSTNYVSPTQGYNKYNGLAGIFESINNMEKGIKIAGLTFSFFDVSMILLGLAIMILAVAGVVVRKSEPILPLIARAGVE